MFWCASLCALVCVGACLSESADELGADDDGFAGPAPTESGCALDGDCRLAASACCECPSFALAADDRADDACAGVACEDQLDCPLVAAVCDRGSCVMRCEPLPCELTCASGFAADEAGCLTCACAPETPAPDRQCTAPEDCVRVPADCCGCARGGDDTAVPSSSVESHLAGLECPVSPECPDVDACGEGLQAGCVAGVCALLDTAVAAPPDGPASDQLCGTPELDPCPAGSACILNALQANDATLLGVGICQGT